AVVARSANNIDVFVVGNDGHVWSTAWPDPQHAGRWLPDFFPLPGQAGFDKTTPHAAVAARSAYNFDVFVVGNAGHVWSTACADPHHAVRLLPDFCPPPGPAVSYTTLFRSAVVARSANNIDVFVVGNDGHVWSTAWPDPQHAGRWLPDFFPLP